MFRKRIYITYKQKSNKRSFVVRLTVKEKEE